MEWVAATAFIFSTAALSVAFFLWRRVRRLERQPTRKSPSPAQLERGLFDSVELSLGAMLEELEFKEREILQRIDRREREILSLIDRTDERAKQTPQPARESEENEAEQHPPVAMSAVPPAGEAPAGRDSAQPAPPEQAPADGVIANDEKSAAVLQLAAEGLDVVTIAKQLGLGKGEVALILKLGQSH